jgi:hypothetical protein
MTQVEANGIERYGRVVRGGLIDEVTMRKLDAMSPSWQGVPIR